VAAYALDIRPRARRSLRQLDPVARKAVAEVIDSLAVDPRPPGVRALTGHRPYLRVRSGDYRVIYLMDDRAASSPSWWSAIAAGYAGRSISKLSATPLSGTPRAVDRVLSPAAVEASALPTFQAPLFKDDLKIKPICVSPVLLSRLAIEVVPEYVCC